MRPRVLLVCAIVLLVCACLATAMVLTLAPGGWTAAKVVMLASCLGAAPWVGFCAANGLIGFVLRLPCPALPLPVTFHGPLPRTAIALTVRNEDLSLVLPPVRRMLDGLDRAGVAGTFALFVLSETDNPAAAEAE